MTAKIYPVVSELPNEDSLFELYPITPDQFIQSVEKIEFDPDESSVPATLQPSFRIGRSWDSNLYLSMAPQNPETLFMYSLSYDQLEPIEGTIFEFLDSLVRNEPRADHLEPGGLSEPWNQVRLANYDAIFEAIDNDGFDVNSVSDDDSLKRTLLMLSLQGCRLSLAKKLIDRQADWNVTDERGLPTLFYSRGFLEGLKLAEDSGCDLNVLDQDGNNLLHVIASESDSNTTDHFRCFDWLCSRIKRDARNNAGNSPQDLLEQQAEQFRSQNTDETMPFSLSTCLESLTR